MARPPDRARCRKAIKILEQFERLAKKFAVRLSANRLDHLTTLREAGTIKVGDLPATLRVNFPSELTDMTLEEIRRHCGMR
jgi:hypothetical protein